STSFRVRASNAVRRQISDRGIDMHSSPPLRGDLTPELLHTSQWTDEQVRAAGIPIHDIPFVTVGGGIGSFVTLDYLRLYGVPTSRLRVLSNIDTPWETYEYLTRVSQIPRPERIRS